MKGRLRGTVERMTRPAAPPVVDDQPGHSAPARSIQVPLCPPVCELQRLRSSSPRIVPGTPTPYNEIMMAITVPQLGPITHLTREAKDAISEFAFDALRGRGEKILRSTGLYGHLESKVRLVTRRLADKAQSGA